ncbi:MAG: BrnT family toxin [Paracoccus sp. (in: a-proteobacteria)]|uniref:BrnT family toxin n=1 Tax=Paracoccus sp. TaxID=267 RepID=UPI0039E59F61
MDLDWDEQKRERTLQERGIDFASVADWDEALTVEDSRTDYGEARFVSLVPINERLCVVAWCVRGDKLRIISLRTANARERKRYDES